MSLQKKLRERLNVPEILLTPGIYDAFGAMMAERAAKHGFFGHGLALGVESGECLFL